MAVSRGRAGQACVCARYTCEVTRAVVIPRSPSSPRLVRDAERTDYPTDLLLPTTPS